jgi:hypothetical protein
MKPGDNVQWTYPPGEGIDDATQLVLDVPKTLTGTIISIKPWTRTEEVTEKIIKIRRTDGEIRYINDSDASWLSLEVVEASESCKSSTDVI